MVCTRDGADGVSSAELPPVVLRPGKRPRPQGGVNRRVPGMVRRSKETTGTMGERCDCPRVMINLFKPEHARSNAGMVRCSPHLGGNVAMRMIKVKSSVRMLQEKYVAPARDQISLGLLDAPVDQVMRHAAKHQAVGLEVMQILVHEGIV